jgi:hypothetical protein
MAGECNKKFQGKVALITGILVFAQELFLQWYRARPARITLLHVTLYNIGQHYVTLYNTTLSDPHKHANTAEHKSNLA